MTDAKHIAAGLFVKACLAFSSHIVKEAFHSIIEQPQNWSIFPDCDAARKKPFPMSFDPKFGPGHYGKIYGNYIDDSRIVA
jgi:hypothetical protein